MYGDVIPRYTRENIVLMQQCACFKPHQQRTVTLAMPITGPFECMTQEGLVRCQDGYLAIDASGYPYPIATATFEATYDAMGPTAPPQQLLSPLEVSMLLRGQQEEGEPRL